MKLIVGENRLLPRRRFVVVAILLMQFLSSHCRAQEPAAQAEQAEPTKAAMIAQLKEVFALLEKKDFEAASNFFFLPPNFKPEMLDGMIDRQEISPGGIERLEKEAKFGLAIEVFGEERGKYFAEKAGVDSSKCYGFNHEAGGETAEVLGLWNGSMFKIIRLDDVGKIPLMDAKAKPETTQPEPATPKAPNLVELARVLPELKAAVDNDSEDVAARAKYAMVLFQLGNVPEAWSQLQQARKLDPQHGGIVRGIGFVFADFEKRGVLAVGVPSETIQSLLGEPDEKVELVGRQRWVYAFYGIDFAEGRIHELVDLRGASEALFRPTETLTIELDGRGWSCGSRKKAQRSSLATFFLPGESASDWTEQFEIERILNAANIGSMEQIGEIMVNQIKYAHPGVTSRVLDSAEDSIIVATVIPAEAGGYEKRHQLIRLMKGPTDLHRCAITIKTAEPTQEYQQKWLAIFKAAKLDPVKAAQDADK